MHWLTVLCQVASRFVRDNREIFVKTDSAEPDDLCCAAAPTISPTVTGVILVAISGVPSGYLSPTLNSYGEYTTTTTDLTQALQISIPLNNAGPFDLTPSNAMATSGGVSPEEGVTVGYSSSGDDLGPGSFNYVYLTQTAHTPPGATPQSGSNSFTAATGIPKDIESGVWYIDASNQLTAKWVNTDGTIVSTTIFQAQDTIGLTGDFNAVDSTFGPASELSFTFQPSANSG